MIVLGLETSGRCGSIAVRLGDGRVAERSLAQVGRRHAQTLVAEIDLLLRAHGLTPRDVSGVAVSVGPGSYTGLRVGVVCAKTFAYATGCGLAAIETFDVIAANAPPDVARLHVVEDAQQSRLYASEFRRVDLGTWQSVGPIRIVSTDDWLAERTGDDVATGPGLTRIAESVRERCRTLEEAAWQPRGATVAELGHARLAAGLRDDVWALEPLYLRPSSAEELWAARHPHDAPAPIGVGRTD